LPFLLLKISVKSVLSVLSSDVTGTCYCILNVHIIYDILCIIIKFMIYYNYQICTFHK